MERTYNGTTLKALEAVNKLPNTSVYCDQWVSAYSERLGEIECHLSEVEPREVMVCTKRKTYFVSLDDVKQENIKNFLENLIA
jgi:hypothetical protein